MRRALTPEQQAINDHEWRRDENWSWGGYSSASDSRVWVPKRNPVMGWTVNLAHTAGRIWLLAILGLPLLIVALVVWRGTTR